MAFGCLQQNIDVHDQVADLLLQLLDLFLVQRFIVLWLRSEGIFGTKEEPLFPVFYLCNDQPVLPCNFLGVYSRWKNRRQPESTAF